MQDPRISAALSVMMGINLMGDDEKMDTEPSPPPPKQKREPTPPPEKTEDESLTEEQKEVIKISFNSYFMQLNKFITLNNNFKITEVKLYLSLYKLKLN